MPGTGSRFPAGKSETWPSLAVTYLLPIWGLPKDIVQISSKKPLLQFPSTWAYSQTTHLSSPVKERVAISLKNLTHFWVGKCNPSLNNKYFFSTALTHSWRQHLDLETNSPCHVRDIVCVFCYKRPTNSRLSMPETPSEQSVGCRRVLLPGAQWFGGFYTFVSDFCICCLVGQITLLEPSSMTKCNTNFLASLFWHSWNFTSNKAAVTASARAALKRRPGTGWAVRAEVWE